MSNDTFDSRPQATMTRPQFTLDELRRALRQAEGAEGARPPAVCAANAPAPAAESPALPAVRVPPGTFHISIEELKRQLRQGNVQAGPNGIRVAPPSSSGTASASAPAAPQISAVVVPKGTFHEGQQADAFYAPPYPLTSQIREFVDSAPEAVFAGKIRNELVWTEWVTDPVTGARVHLAYATSNGGRTAEAYCIDPDMQDHGESTHSCHCHPDGSLCTDLPGIRRTLSQKRARALLWVSGFCQYLKTGRFHVDEV